MHTEIKTVCRDKQASELYLDMAEKELSDLGFKRTVTNILRVLMKKMDNMQEQIGNGNSKEGCKRNDRNEECLGVHITRLDTAKKRIKEWKKYQ